MIDSFLADSKICLQYFREDHSVYSGRLNFKENRQLNEKEFDNM